MSKILDNSKAWLRHPHIYQRLLALALMLLLLWVFRHLAVFFIVFFLSSRALQWLSAKISSLFRLHRNIGLVSAVIGFFAVPAIGIWLFFHFGVRALHSYSPSMSPDAMVSYLREFRLELLSKLPTWMPIDKFLDYVLFYLREFAQNHGASYLNIILRELLYGVIGLIVAVIYLFDEKRVNAFLDGANPEQFFGILRRYFQFLGEAILITVKLQVLVALVNTILTLPVLLVMQLPRLGLLSVIIFFSSLIPILGNFISGAVLVVYSYLHKGIGGVAAFLSITAILHKVEAYYLNPRLSSKHVQLPTLILIFSLIGFEYLFGIIGIFLSFPCLYVGIKISQDMRRAFGTSGAAASS